jgi:hypothetical protein
MTEEEKNKLYDVVDETIQQLIEKFPKELKQTAESIPCFLSEHKDCPGVYGMYTRDTIVIYVDNIWNHCQNTGDDFLNFVKCVYMHEFGHHFGLSEVELRERCL